MKIGIMTFWWSNDNYGQLLQCYALQKYLRDLGHDAFLIRYNWNEDIVPNSFVKRLLMALNPIKLLNFIIKRINDFKVNREHLLFDRQFDSFRLNYIKMCPRDYHHYQDLKVEPPECDAYIVGSDQVWNFSNYPFNRIRGKIHSYMLDFGKDSCLRISYAASWSVTELSGIVMQEIIPLLKRFDYVSVREKNGIELCRKCGRSDSEWVCDPTMLLPVNDYRKLYEGVQVKYKSNTYILLYMLNNKCDFDIESVFDYAKQNGLSVVYVTGNGVVDKYEKYYAKIEEWLWLIDNAKYVITNSFHCCVFSLIFNKPFGAIKLSHQHSRMNVRFDSLWNQFSIQERYVSDKDFTALQMAPVSVSRCEFPNRLQELLNGKN